MVQLLLTGLTVNRAVLLPNPAPTDSRAGAQFSAGFSKIHSVYKDRVQPKPRGFACPHSAMLGIIGNIFFY